MLFYPGSSIGNARPGHPDLAIAAGAPGDERIPAPIGTAATRTDPLSFSPAGNLGGPAATHPGTRKRIASLRAEMAGARSGADAE